MKRFLMCAPRQFAVNYEINPWMHSNIGKVDGELAATQWATLLTQMRSIKNDIYVMQDQPAQLPDLVFTANAALTINNHALVSYFACEQRRPESVIYANILKELNLSIDMSCVEQQVNFEGAGDALLHKKSNTLVLAYGFRSEQKALHLVKDFLRKSSSSTTVLQVQLVNPNFYHLDTCFCPMDNGYILYYPKAFSNDSLALLKEKFGSLLIAVSDEDAAQFSCNAVSVERFLFLNHASAKLMKELLDIGTIVVQSPLDQFMLSGGSAKCLTLELSLTV